MEAAPLSSDEESRSARRSAGAHERAQATASVWSLRGLEVASEIRPPLFPRFLVGVSPKALVTPRREKGSHSGTSRHHEPQQLVHSVAVGALV
jgi:hypothetical protein